MSEIYSESCMKFNNKELKKYLVDNIKKNSKTDIRLLAEDGERIDWESDRRIETIVFDGDNENLFINFYGIHTSLFVFDNEIMFIDEQSKGIYTTSDVYNNVVYEGKLRDKSHMQILQMFSEIINIFIDANYIEITQTKKINSKQYKYQSYIFSIYVDNGNLSKRYANYENIIISY